MRWLRRGLLAAAALGAAGCVLVLAGGLPGGPATAGTGPADGGAGLVRVLPAGDRVLSGPRLPEVNGLASGMDGIWLTGGTATRSHLLYAVNPATGRISATVSLPSRLVINPGDVAVGAGAVWVADGASLYRVVPGLTGQALTRPFATLPRGGLIGDVVTAAGAVWVDEHHRRHRIPLRSHYRAAQRGSHHRAHGRRDGRRRRRSLGRRRRDPHRVPDQPDP